MAPSRTEFGHKALNGQMRGAHCSDCAFGFTSYKVLQVGYKKNHYQWQMRNKPFLIVIYHSSLVKAAMNAAHICTLPNGVNKTPQFLLFQSPKMEQRP
jgi:hypothetical protein